MAAMTGPRKVVSYGDEGITRSLPMAANTLIFNGALVMLNATGDAANAAAGAADLPVMGIAEETVDNTGGAAGDKEIRVRSGLFEFANDATHALTRAMTGDLAYAQDNQTMAANDTGNRPAAGWLHEVTPAGRVVINVPGRSLV